MIRHSTSEDGSGTFLSGNQDTFQPVMESDMQNCNNNREFSLSGLRFGLRLVCTVFPLLTSSEVAYSAERYNYSADGSEVTDSQTGLIWSRCSEGQAWNGSACLGVPALFLHEAGLRHAQSKGNGWRLPNIKELDSIVDRTKANPAIDTSVFPNTPPLSGYLSSTPLVATPNWTRHISFANGANGNGRRDSTALNLRLVRD